MKTFFKIITLGGLFFSFLQFASDEQAIKNIKREADSAFYYLPDSAEIKTLMQLKREEKGEGK